MVLHHGPETSLRVGAIAHRRSTSSRQRPVYLPPLRRRRRLIAPPVPFPSQSAGRPRHPLPATIQDRRIRSPGGQVPGVAAHVPAVVPAVLLVRLRPAAGTRQMRRPEVAALGVRWAGNPRGLAHETPPEPPTLATT